MKPDPDFLLAALYALAEEYSLVAYGKATPVLVHAAFGLALNKAAENTVEQARLHRIFDNCTKANALKETHHGR